MSRYLLIDIGAGTMDVLYHDDQSDLHFKAVVKSPVRRLAEEIESTAGDLWITGCEMGGGPVSQALIARAQNATVTMTQSAAATIHHTRERVTQQGIRIVDDNTPPPKQAQTIRLLDLNSAHIAGLVEGMGVPFDFDVVGICAQDHGVAPAGVSHLDYRHNLFQTRLDQQPHPAALCYRADEIPPAFNRLTAIAHTARELPTRNIYVMDSGMAAILGAAHDIQAAGKTRVIVLDVATSHTVIAAVENGDIAGLVEYHTHDITLARLDKLIVDLADGRIDHQKILKEGGHGAYLRRTIGMPNVEAIIVTGPKRRLVAPTSLPIVWGAPWGDNMMTGTVGLYTAITNTAVKPGH